VVKYVKQNFLYNRIYTNLETINIQATAWLGRTGNMLKHNTTCKVPYAQWCNEQPYLHAWHPLFGMEKDEGYKVIKTNIVKYRGNIYSLPFGTYKNDDTRAFLTETENHLVIRDETGKTIATHLIPDGKGQKIINNNHRRNPSVKLAQLRGQVREFFTYSTDIDTFISRVESHYPRHMRDQFSTLLICCEKYGKLKSEITLEFCVNNNVFSVNDFKSILENQSTPKKHKEPQPVIKPLGGSKTQLIANIEPQKSDIKEYESMFTKNRDNDEPVYTAN